MPETTLASKRFYCAVAAAVVVVVFIVLAIFASDMFEAKSPRTEAYWNSVHKLAAEAQAITDLPTLQKQFEVLSELHGDLGKLDTTGVDERAVAATIRFRLAVAAAQRAVDHARWMQEHPIRTIASRVVGQEAIKKLQLRLLDLKSKTLEAYEFSMSTQLKLASDFPGSSFAVPVPPEVHKIDEALLATEASDDVAGIVSGMAEWLASVVSGLL